jgi:urease beta subunit
MTDAPPFAMPVSGIIIDMTLNDVAAYMAVLPDGASSTSGVEIYALGGNRRGALGVGDADESLVRREPQRLAIEPPGQPPAGTLAPAPTPSPTPVAAEPIEYESGGGGVAVVFGGDNGVAEEGGARYTMRIVSPEHTDCLSVDGFVVQLVHVDVLGEGANDNLVLIKRHLYPYEGYEVRRTVLADSDDNNVTRVDFVHDFEGAGRVVFSSYLAPSGATIDVGAGRAARIEPGTQKTSILMEPSAAGAWSGDRILVALRIDGAVGTDDATSNDSYVYRYDSGALQLDVRFDDAALVDDAREWSAGAVDVSASASGFVSLLMPAFGQSVLYDPDFAVLQQRDAEYRCADGRLVRDGSGPGTAVLVGAIVGGVAALMLIIVAVIVVRNRRRYFWRSARSIDARSGDSEARFVRNEAHQRIGASAKST